MEDEDGWRVTRVKMWEKGHSFAEIDKMSMLDASDVIGVWSGTSKGEAKLSASRARLK